MNAKHANLSNRHLSKVLKGNDSQIVPDWTKKCYICGETPIVPLTGLCGPCTFGEAETKDGNW